MTRRRIALSLTLCLCLAPVAHAAPGKAHEHGAARLDIAVEAGRITMLLDSPLDNLLGFEHAPRTTSEHQRVDALAATLQGAERLLRIDKAAGCQLAAVRFQAPAVGLKTPADEAGAPAAAPDGHGDLNAEFTFDCPRADQARQLDLSALWSAFSGLQRLDVQLVTAQGQARRTLRRPQAALPLR